MDTQYFLNNPPNCLKPYAIALPDKFRNADEEFRVRNTIAFGVRCSCGNSALSIKGTKEEGASLFFGCLYIQCPKCSQNNLIFDPSKNGYDGEFHQFKIDYEGAKQELHRCSRCQGENFELAVLLEPENGEDGIFDENQKARLQDFFNSIAFYAICTNCSNGEWISSVECA